MSDSPHSVATAPISEWQALATCPKGTKVLMLTERGVAVIGKYEPEGYLAWAPFPKRPEWLRKQMENK